MSEAQIIEVGPPAIMRIPLELILAAPIPKNYRAKLTTPQKVKLVNIITATQQLKTREKEFFRNFIVKDC